MGNRTKEDELYREMCRVVGKVVYFLKRCFCFPFGLISAYNARQLTLEWFQHFGL